MAENSIHIEPDTAVFPPTFIQSMSRVAVRIVNDSEKILKYEWRIYSSEEIERQVLDEYDSLSPEDRVFKTTVLFPSSETFTIEPLSSEIWPHRYQQVLISFNPKSARFYQETVYLFNKSTGERVPFTLQGTALPPEARLNVDQINAGHVMLENVYQYQIMLRNTGKVALDWTLIDEHNPNLLFEFEPTSGHLEVDSYTPVNITFGATKVGQFNEIFEFKILGTDTNNIRLSIHGHIVGPTFDLNPKILNFGTVSFGFLYSQTFEIENTSEIPFDFNLTFQPDGTYDLREFSIVPNNGTIPKFSKQKVKLEFLPISTQEYNLKMILDNPKFDAPLMTVPIRAECICPEVSIFNPEIDLGNVFINHRYTVLLTLANETGFPAKYEFIEAMDSSMLDATLVMEAQIGAINPRTKTDLRMFFTPKQVGRIRLMRYIKISGSSLEPLLFTVTANCIGPVLTFSEKSIEFGGIPVLQDIKHSFTIFNNSLIPATYKILQRGDDVFSIGTMNGAINPGETREFTVNAFMDDIVQFNSEFVFIFDYLSPIVVKVSGFGTGTPIVASILMDKIDMSFSFCGETVTKEFTLENRGRRAQTIHWDPKKPKIEGSPSFAFTIEPEFKVLYPGDIIDYVMTITSNHPCIYSLKPSCQSSLTKKNSNLFSPQIDGRFVMPILSFETSSMEFVYIHDVEREEEITGKIRHGNVPPTQELLVPFSKCGAFINQSELPLTVFAEAQPPFSITPTMFEHTARGETVPFTITFDPRFKRDFSTEVINSKATFSFKNNSTRANVELKAIMHFPNISFNFKGPINFGALMKNTETTKSYEMTNSSAIPVVYEWELYSNTVDEVSRVFDVYPISGSLKPGQTSKLAFTFFAFCSDRNESFSGTAICHVIGGPDYTIQLIGESAALDYRIRPKEINLGKRNYDENLSSAVVIENISAVEIPFQVKIPRFCQFKQLTVEPSRGVIPPGSIVTLSIGVIPGTPKSFKENFFVQVGRFDEIEIELQADCYFQHLSSNMPRAEDDPLLAIYAKRPRRSYWGSADGTIPSERLSDIEKQIVKEYLDDISINMPKSTRKGKKVFNGLCSSKFLIDFGRTVLGVVKTLTYTLTSKTPYPISFDIITQTLEGSGFYIEPKSFAGIPANESIDISFSFDPNKRTTEQVGDVEYEVPLIFSDDLAYFIKLKAHLSMPMLDFSSHNFEFDTTIVGQKRILSLQIQNNNTVPVEFNIGAPKDTLIRNRVQENPFNAVPSLGVLPPSSYTNVDLIFAPGNEKPYQMQFPISIKHNTHIVPITVKGNGALLKMLFDPPLLEFPPINPYSKPITKNFKITNPTEYPISVYCQQFDFQLLIEQLLRERAISGQNNIDDGKKGIINKFAFCVIVNGPIKSGRTTIANDLHEHLKLPVISLKDLWAPINENPESTQADYVAVVNDKIRETGFERGFIVDGLDGLPEPTETDQFIAQASKHKNAVEDATKSPYNVYPHPVQTSLEQALNYLIAALDGHYIFNISLQSNEAIMNEHELQKVNETKEAYLKKRAEEMSKFLNMSETDYNQLSEEERATIDNIRTEYRKEIIDSQVKEEESSRTVSTKQSRAASKRQTEKHQSKQKPPRGKQAQMNPFEKSFLVSTFTYGSIAQRVYTAGDTFQVVDPYVLTKKERPEDEMLRGNTIVVNGLDPINQIIERIHEWIPTMKELKDSAFTRLLTPARLLMPSDDAIELEDMPEFFRIVNKTSPGEWPLEKEEVKVSSKRNSRRTTRDAPLTPMLDPSITDEIDKMMYTPHWDLEPGQSVELKVEFNGQNVGDYLDNLHFLISDCTSGVFNYSMKAKCLYPEIERIPKNIFGKTAQKLTLRSRQCFIMGTQEFQFGSQLIVSGKVGGKNWLPAYRSPLKLANVGPLPLELTYALGDNSKTSPWHLDSKGSKLDVGGQVEINLGFNPLVPDVYKTTLTIFVKDNPDPLIFTIGGEGCSPLLEPSTLNLEFERLLPNQSRTLNLELRNNRNIPAAWKLKGHQAFSPNVEFSAEEGIVAPKAGTTISITYTSPKVFSIKKPFQIDIYDEKKVKTYTSHHININAETYDVAVDMQYPKGLKELNFGPLKVGEEKTINCLLKNKGKYGVQYSFALSKNVMNVLKITNMTGTIQPTDKGAQIGFKFASNQPFKADHMKGITLKLVDIEKNEPLSTSPVVFSANAMYSAFQISPEDCVDFGGVAFNSPESQSFTIKNTGLYPFDFDIIPVEKPEPVSARSARGKNKKGPQKKSQAPRPAKRRTVSKLSIGQFTLSQAWGTVNPGDTTTISIEYASSSEGIFEESFHLKVSDTNQNPEIKLKATTFVPAIEDKNFELIFPGQNICIQSDIKRSPNINAFVEDSMVYHFAPIRVGDEIKSLVVLKNTNVVPVSLDLILTSETECYKVTKNKFEIPGSEENSFEIIYKPNTVGEFNASLEAIVRGRPKDRPQSLKFGLQGTAAISSVTAIGGSKPFNFGKALVGTSKEHKIILENKSTISGRISFQASPNADFEIVGIDSSQKFELPGGERFTISVFFKPQATRKSSLELIVKIEQQDDIRFVFNGEGLEEDLIIDGTNGDDDTLIFNDVVIAQPTTRSFFIRNVSENYLRYQWSPAADFTFLPSVGHLGPNQVREITVTYLSEKPAKANTKSTCQWIRIEPEDFTDWDDSMRVIRFVAAPEEPPPRSSARRRRAPPSRKSSKNISINPIQTIEGGMMKVVEIKPEPSYKPGLKGKDIILKLTSVCDTVKVALLNSEIEFSPTMMFETRSTSFKVQNPSNIRMDYEWVINSCESLRTDYVREHGCPFSIEPSSGSINANSATVFKAMFSPVEVDDFYCYAVMRIPYLSMEQPSLRMSGISRRPICHFNIQLSDYLTRRHPDYTEELPSDVKCVEISSKAIGESAILRFEVVNTTNLMYESCWKKISGPDGCVVCDTPIQVISSGRHYNMQFTYTPTTVKPIETLWTFSIPEHDISFSLLVVGRVKPT